MTVLPKKDLVFPKGESWKMFDQISPRYDLLNRLLSFGLDLHWRRVFSRFLPERDNLKVLDLATGTADVLIAFVKYNARIIQAVGIDMAEQMLKVGQGKVEQLGLKDKIILRAGDINSIPFGDNCFDSVSVSFGIRNVDDPSRVLGEMSRVLSQGGRALVLEFSMPSNRFVRALHVFYLRIIVPLIGWIFSGHYKAYKYLNQTIEIFPYGEDFCRLMRDKGFQNVKANPLCFGAATIYQGDKS